MAKIIRGTKNEKGVVTLKTDQPSLRAIRCPGCFGIAQTRTTTTGKSRVVCQTCGAQFNTQKF